MPSITNMVGLPLFVSTRFQVLFHSPSGVLFTFPSRYWFTIDRDEYLALPRGRGRFPQDFTCPVVLTCCDIRTGKLSRTGLSPSLVVRSRRLPLTLPFSYLTQPLSPLAGKERTQNSLCRLLSLVATVQPSSPNADRLTDEKFWLLPFRSPLLRE